MANTFQIRRGIVSGLPAGSAGEPLFTTDQIRLYVGSAGGNRLLGLLHKIDATVAPTVNEDAGDGYSVGSRWIDTTNAKGYVLVDSTVGAAVWQQTSGAGTGGINQLTGDVTAGPGTGSQAATIAANAVTDAKFRQSAGLSLVGRSANSTGNTADITAASDGQVMRRSGTQIGFGNVDLASSNAVTGTLPQGNGGTGFSTYALGDLLYSSATNVLSKLSGNTTATAKLLGQTGTGTISAAPAWITTIGAANLPTGNWIGNQKVGGSGGFVITGASGVYQATGITFTAPTTGTYLITAQLRGEIQPGAAASHFITAKLADQTGPTDVTDINGVGMETIVVLSSQNGVNVNLTAAMSGICDLTGSHTYELYAKRNGTVWTVSQLVNDTNGRTKINAVRIY